MALRAAARAPASSFIVELTKMRSRWSGVRIAVMLASRGLAGQLSVYPEMSRPMPSVKAPMARARPPRRPA
jgi:hypothetical protein